LVHNEVASSIEYGGSVSKLIDIDSSHYDIIAQGIHQVGVDLSGIGDIEVGIISRVVGQSKGGYIELDIEGSREPVVEKRSACRDGGFCNHFKSKGQSGSVSIDPLEVGGSIDNGGEITEFVFVEVVVQGEGASSRLIGSVGGTIEAGGPRVTSNEAISIHDLVDNAGRVADGLVDESYVVEGVTEGHAVGSVGCSVTSGDTGGIACICIDNDTGVEAGGPRVAGYLAIGIHDIIDKASRVADGLIDESDVVEGVTEGHAVGDIASIGTGRDTGVVACISIEGVVARSSVAPISSPAAVLVDLEEELHIFKVDCGADIVIVAIIASIRAVIGSLVSRGSSSVASIVAAIVVTVGVADGSSLGSLDEALSKHRLLLRGCILAGAGRSKEGESSIREARGDVPVEGAEEGFGSRDTIPEAIVLLLDLIDGLESQIVDGTTLHHLEEGHEVV